MSLKGQTYHASGNGKVNAVHLKCLPFLRTLTVINNYH